MFGEQISRSPRIASPWSARLSTSASTSASTTAPPTPPSHLPFDGDESHPLDGNRKDQHHQLPDLHLLSMSCDDALSDISDEADGFFSLDMDVSIDQQLQDHPPKAYTQTVPVIPSMSERLDSSPQRNGRDTSASPLAHAAVRRASETVAFSSSPLQGVGLDPIMASRSRNSPALNAVNASTRTESSATAANVDTGNASSPSLFGPIAPEVDQKGNLEYKLKILPPSRERFDRLVTQLKWRLLEGGGIAVYEIGVLDDGTLIGLDSDSMKDSLKLLSLMAAEVGAKCHVQRVLALEKVAAPNQDATSEPTDPSLSSSRLASSESDLSLRALSPAQATQTLKPYILAATDLDQHVRTQLCETGSAGLYRFDIAEQLSPIPPPLASLEVADADDDDATVASVAAIDPVETAALDVNEMAVSAQTKRRLLKSTLNGLPSSSSSTTTTNHSAAPGRAKKDILQGRDQSAIVYLPSKEEKRILRAAEAVHQAAKTGADATAANTAKAEAQADRALSHTEAQERKMMAKMTRVADSVQPKTARARARARKSAASNGIGDATPTYSESPSPTPSPAMTAVGAPSASFCSTGAYTGYENVMSAFGVLSERAARTLYGRDEDLDAAAASAGVKARLIVEAVVRRDADSEDNYVDFQGAKSKLRLDEQAL